MNQQDLFLVAALSASIAVSAGVAQAQSHVIGDDNSPVNISDLPDNTLLEDILFQGESSDPIKAILNIDQDTVFDVSRKAAINGYGAIIVQEGSQLSIVNAATTTGYMGGAIEVTSKLTITVNTDAPVLFQNNTYNTGITIGSPVGGGAIGIGNNKADLTVTNALFKNNSATGIVPNGTVGGAISNYLGTVTCYNVAFEGNRVIANASGGSKDGDAGGGAIGAEFSSPGEDASRGVFIYGGSFTGNEAIQNASATACGGAILMLTQQLTVEGGVGSPVLFKDNRAYHSQDGEAYGGAIVFLSNQTGSRLTDVRFENNSAVNANNLGGSGGAIYVNSSAVQHSFTRVDFEGNSAEVGGAIYLDKGSLSFTDTNITNNTADTGAALYSAANTNVVFNASAGGTSTISGNKTSDGEMSGIYLDSASSFTVNTEAGGSFNTQDSIHAELRNGGTAFTKTGKGTWNVSAENELVSSGVDNYAVFTVEEGTLKMLENSTLSIDGINSELQLKSEGIFDLSSLTQHNAVSTEGSFTLCAGSVTMLDADYLNDSTAIVDVGTFSLDMSQGTSITIDTINLVDDDLGQIYTLFTFDSLADDYGTGQDADNYFTLRGENSSLYNFFWSSNSLYIQQTSGPVPIPEPGGLMVMALLAGAFYIRRR